MRLYLRTEALGEFWEIRWSIATFSAVSWQQAPHGDVGLFCLSILQSKVWLLSGGEANMALTPFGVWIRP